MILFKDYQNVDSIESELSFSVQYRKNEGYILTVIPVKRSTIGGFSFEEFGAFTGYRMTLLKVDRQSANRLKQCIQYIKDNKQTLIDNYLDYLSLKS